MLIPFFGESHHGVEVKIYELEPETSIASVDEQMKLVPIVDRIVVPGEILAFPTATGRIYLISKEIPWFTNIPVDSVS